MSLKRLKMEDKTSNIPAWLERGNKHHDIDLREFILIFWQNKLLILLISIGFALIGGIYSFLAPQVWISEAEITQPSLKDIDSLEFDISQFINAKIPVESLSGLSRKSIYSDFVNSFNSSDNKRQFFIESGYLDDEAKVRGVTDEKGKLFLLNSIMGKISAKAQSKSNDNITLSFSADNASEAKAHLISYISFIQKKEIDSKLKEMRSIFGNRVEILQAQYESMRKDTLKQLQDDILRTEYSLRISRAAGIDNPVENLNVRDGFAIELGSRALAEKLQVLKEMGSPEILNPALNGLRLELTTLTALKLKSQPFQSFSYVSSPDEPLFRDSPKRSLIVVLAALLGGGMGIGIVLTRYAFRRSEQV